MWIWLSNDYTRRAENKDFKISMPGDKTDKYNNSSILSVQNQSKRT